MTRRTTRRTQIKFLGYFIITNLLVAGIIGSLLYWRSSQAIWQETISSEQSAFTEMNRSTELLMNQVELFMSQIATNPDITKMVKYNEDDDYEKMMAINNDLSWKKVLLSFIYNISLYYPDEEMVYEVNSGFYKLEDYPYSNLLASVVKQGGLRERLPVSRIGSMFGPDRNLNVVSIVEPIPMDGSAPQAYAVINIEASYFRDIINSYINKDRMEIYFTNNQDEVIASNRVDGNYAEIIEKTALSALNSGSSGYKISKFKGDKLLVSEVTSEIYGWRFVSVIPYDTIVGKVQFIKSYSIAVILLAIALGLVLSLRFSNQISAPLGAITELLNRTGNRQNDNAKDVFKYITGNIQRLVERNTQFEQHMSEHLPVLRNNFLMHILMGHVPEQEELEARLGYYDVQYNADAWHNVCIIPLANFRRQSGQHSEQEMNMLAVYLIEMLNEFLDNGRRGLVLSTKPDEIVIIVELSEDGATEGRNAIPELALNIQNVVNERIGYMPAIGIGEPTRQFTRLSESYEQAERALQYQMLLGDRSILFYTDIKSMQDAHFNYPFKLERRLLEALATGEEAVVVKHNGEIFTAFMSGGEYGEVFYYYMHLLNSTVKFVFEMGVNLEHMTIGGNLYREILECSSNTEVRIWFEELFVRISRKINERTSMKSYGFVQSLEQYIQDNIDKDLSLAVLAAQVHLSPAYMRKLFKEGTGRSIKSYINEIRFEQAKQLLVSTSLTVAEVGERIGYGKVHAFIYFFKENAGMAPGEYRLKIRREEEAES
ncbi:helix-turn-helix domain-containing protein [Cohnella fermenti]|nr:helix-turn-helix domain-containing protein [Cohnella fermenti]